MCWLYVASYLFVCWLLVASYYVVWLLLVYISFVVCLLLVASYFLCVDVYNHSSSYLRYCIMKHNNGNINHVTHLYNHKRVLYTRASINNYHCVIKTLLLFIIINMCIFVVCWLLIASYFFVY